MGEMRSWEGGGCIHSDTSLDRSRVTVNASKNAWGSWVEIHSSLPAQSSGMLVDFGEATNDYYLSQIGIGASGSEIVLIDNIYFNGTEPDKMLFDFPITLPQGTRIAIRSRYNTNGPSRSYTADIYVHYSGLSSMNRYHHCDYIGRHDVTAGDGVYGIQYRIGLSDSRTRNYKGFLLHMDRLDEETDDDVVFEVDLYYDANASKPIVESMCFSIGSDTHEPNSHQYYPVPIEKTNAIYIKALARNSTTAAQRTKNFTLWGLR